MSDGGISIDLDYLKSAPGILKIIEFVFGLIVAGICTIDVFFLNKNGGGFVIFVALVAAIGSLILFILNFISIWSRLPTWRLLLEFVFCLACVVGYFISGVIAAAHAPKRDPSIAATAFFAFMSFLAYAVDAFFAFWIWRAGVQEEAPSTNTTTSSAPKTTTDTTATNVQQTQY